MAYFAKIKNDVVEQVIAVNNQDIVDGQNDESEEIGVQLCRDLFGGDWVQTSYNTRGGVNSSGRPSLRKNYAGVGFTYDSTRDAFIPPQPYASWTLNEDTCLWDSPVPYPTDDLMYSWDEDTTSWVEVQENN
jgi:hypothetical protein